MLETFQFENSPEWWRQRFLKRIKNREQTYRCRKVGKEYSICDVVRLMIDKYVGNKEERKADPIPNT